MALRHIKTNHKTSGTIFFGQMNLLDHAHTTVYAAWKHLIEPITVRKHNAEDVFVRIQKNDFVDHFDVPRFVM